MKSVTLFPFGPFLFLFPSFLESLNGFFGGCELSRSEEEEDVAEVLAGSMRVGMMELETAGVDFQGDKEGNEGLDPPQELLLWLFSRGLIYFPG